MATTPYSRFKWLSRGTLAHPVESGQGGRGKQSIEHRIMTGFGSRDLNLRSPICFGKESSQTDNAIHQCLFTQVTLSVWDVSQLRVSIYPRFLYDARGGGGPGIVTNHRNRQYHVRFDASKLDIPPLDYRSATVLGLPIPPPLRIDITTQTLEGTIDLATGTADLSFGAEFVFSIGSLYRAAPLSINTTLTTGTSRGDRFQATGQTLINGKGRLVGVSKVAKTDDPFLDAFLMLPTEALAELATELRFT